MKKIKLFVLICLTFFCAKTVSAQATVDSLLIKFIKDFESKVVYIVNDTNPSKTVYSKIYKEYIDFDEKPTYYAEAYEENVYLIQKCLLSDGTCNIEITIFNKNEYKSIQCSFLLKDDKAIEGVSIIFYPKNGSKKTLVYDKTYILSNKDFWIQKSAIGPKKSITSADFEKQIKILLL